jgi:general secretion pathway protein D
VQQLVLSFFDTTGVFLDPPKSAFFNERVGMLLVRATLEELDTIQAAIEVLNMTPPQVTIEAKFTEIAQDDSNAMGFDWMLGNVSMGGGKIGAQGGTAPSFQGSGGSGPFPGYPSTVDATGAVSPSTFITPSGSDQVFSNGLRNTTGTGSTIPALGTVTGILTDPQFRVVIRALSQRGGIEVLSAPKVTTVSGRQAQIQVTDVATIVTGVGQNANVGAAPAGAGGVAGGGATGGAGALGFGFNSQPLPFGPTLDVIPYVSADGYTVQMTIIPTITDFVGYDDPGGFIPTAVLASGGSVGTPITALLPLPRFRVRQVTTTVSVWDGQTVVLGGLITEDVNKFRDKIPLLGDIPFLGRLFRSEASSTSKRNLAIFVTPTIIDPAGQPRHSPDNLPFDPNNVPMNAIPGNN